MNTHPEPLLPAQTDKRYRTIVHYNSRRGEKQHNGKRAHSFQLVRDPEGEKLPRMERADVIRGHRSKYRRI